MCRRSRLSPNTPVSRSRATACALATDTTTPVTSTSFPIRALLARATIHREHARALRARPPPRAMGAASGALKPPPPVVIDRDAFKTTLRVRAVRVPTRETDAVLRALRGFALDLPKVKAVAKDEDAGGNLVLLCDKVRDATLEGVIPEEKLRVVRGRVGGAIEVTEYEVPLSYEYFNAPRKC